jgi:signal transduction histidine kinase
MNKENDRSIDWPELIAPVIPARKMRWIDALVLVTGYIALDWVSYFHPLHGLNITPWDPAPALGLVFVLRFGWKSAVAMALAIFLGDAWIRDLAFTVSAALAVLLAAGYGAIGEALRRRLKSDEVFVSRRGLFEWFLIVVVGTLVNSAAFISSLTALDLILTSEWATAFTRHWIGDSVGILVTMPVIWMVSGERGRALLRLLAMRGETVALLLATGAALWIAFSVGAESEFKYFYVLFLPIVWAAARQGFSGAVLIAAVIQIGIIVAVNRLGFSAISVLEIQMLTVVLAMLGFFVGVVIDEQRRVSSELRQTLRLAAAGEMAGALAHELNQPLTALSAYATACDKLLEQGDTGDTLRQAVRRIVSESERAGEVVRRLRDFFRTGTTHLESVALEELLTSSVASFSGRAEKAGIHLTLAPVPDCVLLADRLQLEVVIRNLLSNAFDAVSHQSAAKRLVHLSAVMEGPGRVCVQLEDSGPGLSAATAARLFEPFESTKSSGLGLGLVISRAIVDAHGGSLWAEVVDHGVFKLVLPVEGKVVHGDK